MAEISKAKLFDINTVLEVTLNPKIMPEIVMLRKNNCIITEQILS